MSFNTVFLGAADLLLWNDHEVLSILEEAWTIEEWFVFGHQEHSFTNAKVDKALLESTEGFTHDGNKQIQQNDNQEKRANDEDAPYEVEFKDKASLLKLGEGIKLEVTKGHSVDIDKGIEWICSNKADFLGCFSVSWVVRVDDISETLLHDVETTSETDNSNK